MANPAKAIDAILDAKKEIGGYTVYPLSVARYALLEKYDSPLLTGEDNTEKTITSLYVMTQPADVLAKESANGVLEMKALAWADELNIFQLKDIVENVRNRLREIAYLAPEGNDEGTKKKARTDG